MLNRLAHGLIDRFVASRGPLAYPAYLIGSQIVKAYDNVNTHMSQTGEEWLQRQLAPMLHTVFDVGANDGDWASGVLTSAPNARIYCFEAIPTTFRKLDAKMAGRAILLNEALSSTPGTLEFNAAPGQDHISSVYDVARYNDELAIEKTQVRADTGDAFCVRASVDHIDWLKVDTEGHDFDVLTGFADTLTADRIDMIQFEYNYFTLLAGRKLLDFYQLLGDRYVIGRLLQRGIEVFAYDWGLDNFHQSNWIAIRRPLVTEALA